MFRPALSLWVILHDWLKVESEGAMAVVGRLDSKAAYKIHPEVMADNFSQRDCDLTFFSVIRSIQLRNNSKNVLDYGAGRNSYAQDFDPTIHSYLINDLRNLRSTGSHVTAVDVSNSVVIHPTSDRQVVIDPTISMPFEDEYFEHISNPKFVSSELQRLLRPGGWLVVRTPNRYGYLKIVASIVPNRLHNAVLRYVQPERKEIDTFPTLYRLNSLSEMQRHFDNCRISCITDSWEPAYFFGKTWLYRIFQFVHWILPKKLGTAHVFIGQKNS
jgi:SAM-dependent methyltransferase